MPAAGGDGGELAAGGARLPIVIASPALEGAIFQYAARVLGAGGDWAVLVLSGHRSVQLAVEIVAPALGDAVLV